MPTYRAYRLDDRRHIRSAEWVDAPSDAKAIEQASELCDETTPKVEVWHAARLVDEIDCAETD